MRRTLKTLSAILVLALIAAPSALAGGEGWTDNYETAKKTAAEQKKDMILDFTGSDWCGWCIRLNEEVFSKDAFKTYAAENFVLVELDFPNKKKQSAQLKAQNQKLKEQFGIRGYPSIYLTDAAGRPYAKTGYQRGGAENYVKHLETLKQVRIERDRHFAAAAEADGVAKAKHLHEGLQAVGDELATKHYEETIKQIMSLDAENEAGLKKYYGDLYAAEKLGKELQAAMQGARTEPEVAVRKIDKILEKQDLPTSFRQKALVSKSEVQMFIIKDKDAAKITLLEAIEVSPDSPLAEQLRNAMKRFFPEDETEEPAS